MEAGRSAEDFTIYQREASISASPSNLGWRRYSALPYENSRINPEPRLTRKLLSSCFMLLSSVFCLFPSSIWCMCVCVFTRWRPFVLYDVHQASRSKCVCMLLLTCIFFIHSVGSSPLRWVLLPLMKRSKCGTTATEEVGQLAQINYSTFMWRHIRMKPS